MDHATKMLQLCKFFMGGVCPWTPLVEYALQPPILSLNGHLHNPSLNLDSTQAKNVFQFIARVMNQ